MEILSNYLGEKIYSRISNLSDYKDDDNVDLPFIAGRNNNFPNGGGNNGKRSKWKGP